MAASFRFRRMMVRERRARQARAVQLAADIRTWRWWSFFLSARVMPVIMILFLGWSFGVVSGVAWMAKEIDGQYTCEAKHAD